MGKRTVTMADVARAAGVSTMTVSYAYRRPDRVAAETRRHVLEVAGRLGYRGPNPAASSLRTGRAHQLGVVLGEHLTYAFEDPQATAFLAGVARECVDRGLGMTLIPVSGENDASRLSSVDVAGYVVWTTAEDAPILDALDATNRPVVVSGGPSRPGWGLVRLDDRFAAKAVAEVGLAGARHPAVVALPDTHARAPSTRSGPRRDTVTFPVTRARLEGFADAVATAGLEWAEVPVVFLSRNDQAEALAAVRNLLGTRPATDTIIAMSDQIALGTLAAVRAAGRDVPGDVAVTGWDDGGPARDAGLTTLSQSLQEQGTICARLVLGAEASGPGETVTAPWHVTERATTRTPARDER